MMTGKHLMNSTYICNHSVTGGAMKNMFNRIDIKAHFSAFMSSIHGSTKKFPPRN